MDRRSRLVATLYAVCGVLLVPWIGLLIEQLHGHAWQAFRHDVGRSELPYAESLAMACLAELPLATLLAWTAWRALEWAAPGPAAPSPERPRTAASRNSMDVV